jgi:hypothetical protein
VELAPSIITLEFLKLELETLSEQISDLKQLKKMSGPLPNKILSGSLLKDSFA